MTHEDELKIGGCGLFFFNSDLSKERQLEIFNWFESLSKEHQEMINDIKHDASDEATFFSQGD